VINLFDDLPRQADEELFTELLSRKGVRIERIVSTGQSTPADKPYNQEYDEWVLLVSGSAGLWIEGECERDGWDTFLPLDSRALSTAHAELELGNSTVLYRFV
jgi:cupin 2 domain-containing protein